MNSKIYLYDTTLRDGSQMEGVNFSILDKLKITEKLNNFGMDFIEGGWPGSNPKEEEYFKKIRKLKNLKSQIVAFSATVMKNKKPSEDVLIQKVLASQTKWVTVFGKTWNLHTEQILKISLAVALDLIYQTIKYLRAKGRQVIFDAEHFFDGFKNNPAFSLECLKMAEKAGVWNITLCDTNGGTLPEEIQKIIHAVQKEIHTPLGIHAHNDTGVAVANSLSAITNGANLIQGTINGFGERTGNANLGTIIADLKLKLKYPLEVKIPELTKLSNFIFETANLRSHDNQPYVGAFAFSHKGGIHASAVAKIAESYQHINPALVGNFSRVTISELAGKSNVVAVAKRLGFQLKPDDERTRAILKQVKELESAGFYYETAEASFALLILRSQLKYRAPFELLDYLVVNPAPEREQNNCLDSKSGCRAGDRDRSVTATVKIKVGESVREFVGSGNGPVNALDTAFRRAVSKFFPEIKDVQLTDYKVRILDSSEATGAKTRVLIVSADGDETWTTVGCSPNIIEASWQALSDSLEYAIWRRGKY